MISRVVAAPRREASTSLEQRLRARLDRLTKPRGLLVDLAVHVGVVFDAERPRLVATEVLEFAADHGIAEDGVTAHPKAVTAQMLRNYLDGGAAINVLVRQHVFALTLVDAGVQGFVASPDGDAASPRLWSRRIGDGTRNLWLEPAMSRVRRGVGGRA